MTANDNGRIAWSIRGSGQISSLPLTTMVQQRRPK
jgi:hypothetical protein